jgi:hypothetical protein
MKQTQTRENVLSALGLVVFAWVVRYWHIQTYGLYMDDLTRIPRAFEMSTSELGQLVANSFFFEGLLSRPLHASFIYTFSFLGAQFGRIEGLYFIAFLIYALNIVLFFLFVRRIANKTVAVIASIIFIVFPADTTQIFLTQAFGIQPSITFLLLGFHAYHSKRLPLAYTFVFLSLLTYEAAFIIILVAPLLSQTSSKPSRGAWGQHLLIMSGLLVFGFLLRYFEGDQELRGLGSLDTLWILVRHVLVGPMVSLGSFLFRPIETFFIMWTELFYWLRDLSPILARVFSASRLDGSVEHLGMLQNSIRLITGVAIIILMPMILWISNRSRKENAAGQVEKGDFPGTVSESVTRVPLHRLFVSTALMLALAYPLILVIPAYTIRGRNTRVHYAAVLGASLLVALAVYLVWRRMTGKWGWIARAGVIAVLLAFLISSAFIVQLDYRNAWDYQQTFWQALLPVIEDVGNGEVVLVEPKGLIDSWQIEANTWNMPRMLPQLFHFPEGDRAHPRAYRLLEGWEAEVGNLIVLDDRTTQAPPSLYTTVDPEDVIFIETSSGLLIRSSEWILEDGMVLTFKIPSPDHRQAYPTTKLYDFLIEDD